MRGKRISKETRRLDVVLEAVRYEEGKRRLRRARGYTRRGFIWSDRMLFDRNQLIDLVKANKRVVAGGPAEIEGDFEVFARIRFEEDGQQGTLMCESGKQDVEDLGLPLF